MRFTHSCTRAVAAIVATAGLSAAGLVAVSAPASAATVCGTAGYPAPVATTTSLSLTRTVGQYRSVNVATVRVSSGAGTPSGSVHISVSNGAVYSVALNRNGVAQHQLPRNLAPQTTYTVTASYDGQGSCRPSGPVSKFYTVVKCGTSVRGLEARDLRRGGRPSVTGHVASYTGATPRGSVLVTLSKNGHVQKSKTVTVYRGGFAARFARTAGAGTWTAKATLLASDNFKSSSDSTRFRIGRR